MRTLSFEFSAGIILVPYVRMMGISNPKTSINGLSSYINMRIDQAPEVICVC
jgi:hypothetical protein